MTSEALSDLPGVGVCRPAGDYGDYMGLASWVLRDQTGSNG